MSANSSQNGMNGSDQAAISGAARQGAQVLQQSGRAANEALHRTSEATVEVARRNGEATAEVMQRGSKAVGEAVRRNAEVLAEGQRDLMQTAAQQVQQVNHKLAEAVQDTVENMRSLTVPPNAAIGSLQDVQRGAASFVEGIVQANLHATQGLFQLANPSAFIELQQRFAREYLDALMQGTALLVRATRRTADEALRPLEQAIGQRQQAQRA